MIRTRLFSISATTFTGTLLFLFSIGCNFPPEKPPENIILIVVDTLRADVLNCYGGPAYTPTMDRLAAEGIRFSQARSHIPITGPSHSSLFTSLWPQQHGFTNNAMHLKESLPTMAELLAARNYHTAAFISLGVLKSEFGLNRGFDTYVDTFGADWFRSAGEINIEVEKYLKTLPEGQHFLWIHYSDPHEPYQDPDSSSPDIHVFCRDKEIATLPVDGRAQHFEIPLIDGHAEIKFIEGARRFEKYAGLGIINARLGSEGNIHPGTGIKRPAGSRHRNNFVCYPPGTLEISVTDKKLKKTRMDMVTKLLRSHSRTVQAYFREVEYTDRQLGRLLARLKTEGLLDNSLVIFTADHGEGLGQHELGGHIEQLYDSLLHIPLILSYPGRLPAGVVDERAVSLVDILPTLAALTGIPTDPSWRGIDLLSKEANPLPLVAATYRPEAKRNLEAVLEGNLKLIRNSDDGSMELYDLGPDSGEHINIITERVQDASRLKKLLDQLLEGVEKPEGTRGPLEEDTRNKLRALGYAD